MCQELGILKIFNNTSMPRVPAYQNGCPPCQQRYTGWILNPFFQERELNHREFT